MEVDGTPAAAWYGWRVGGTYAYYNAGFDPSHSNLRPGMVLMAAVIHAALEEGAAEFDFLLGNEAYKHRFADGNREVSDITLVKRAHPAAAVARAEQAARRVARRSCRHPCASRTRAARTSLRLRRPASLAGPSARIATLMSSLSGTKVTVAGAGEFIGPHGFRLHASP